MKQFIALICAAMMICVMLCSCSGDTAEKTKEKASEAASDIKKDMENSVTENKEIIAQKETIAPTTSTDGDMMETIGDAVATEWNDMVENGEVNDGDGNVGDRENNDGDGNAAPEN